jgi:hypothetical protein
MHEATDPVASAPPSAGVTRIRFFGSEPVSGSLSARFPELPASVFDTSIAARRVRPYSSSRKFSARNNVSARSISVTTKRTSA